MANYFNKFPTIQYKGKEAYDITRRSKFLSQTLNNPYVFLPYTVKEGERAEDVAHHYYGSVKYTWLVLMSNDMVDPYTDWPLSEDLFNSYLIDKYKGLLGYDGHRVIDWTQNETITENVIYYYKHEFGQLIRINGQSLIYEYLMTERNEPIQVEDGENIFLEVKPPEGYYPYRIFDFENDLNENKREIVLIDRQYLPIIEDELRTTLAL